MSVEAVGREGGDAEVERDGHRTLIVDAAESLAHHALLQALCERHGALGIGVRQNEEELVSAIAPGMVVFPADLPKGLSDTLEHLIADRMAVRVVEELEVI